jgi:hypothetical protein
VNEAVEMLTVFDDPPTNTLLLDRAREPEKSPTIDPGTTIAVEPEDWR